MLFLGLCLTSADQLEEANSYMDEVISVYVPLAVETSRLNLYELPNFSNILQDRTSDGATLNTKITYHAGNLTGLQNVNRKSCQEPSWTFGNVSVVCNFLLPQLDVKYEVRFEEATGHRDFSKFRKHEYGVSVVVKDVEFSLEISSSPHVKIPAIKKLKLLDQGKPAIRFETDNDIAFDDLSRLFYHRYFLFFQDIIYGPYRLALETAVESIPYPHES